MSRLINLYKQLIHFFTAGIWQATEHELSRSNRFFYRFAKIIILSVNGFIKERLNVRASALTYSILFAMIPLFALMIAIGKGFGVEKMIENSLDGTFIGQSNLTPTVMGFVQRYLETTQQGVFIGIGLIILLGSVINFFMQVENAFNNIWKVEKLRSPINMISTYFSTVLILPIVIVVSGGISVYVSSFLSQSHVFQLLSPIVRFLISLTPYVVISGVFTVVYLAVPNTRVRFPNALIAGIVAGCTFQAFQFLYISGQVYLSRYNAVYGGFAAIPLLLLWLQISSSIVLLGAEISYVAQNLKYYEYELQSSEISPRYKNLITIYILYLIIKRFETPEAPYAADEITEKEGFPIKLVHESLNWLTSMGFILEITKEELREKYYLPAFDINQLTVRMVSERMSRFGSEEFMNEKNPDFFTFTEKTLRYCEHDFSDKQDSILLKDI